MVPLILISCTLCAAFSTASYGAGESTAAPSSDDNTAPRQYALLVGINVYLAAKTSAIEPLKGTLNDLELIRNVLMERFPGIDIKTLRNEEATRARIIGAFEEHFIEQARPGDLVVFHYSGHGAQNYDQAPLDEFDGYDETLVPYDSRQGEIYDIRDDEFNDLLSRLRTDNVVVIFDSCNSGGGTRAPGSASRGIGRDPRLKTADGAVSRTSATEGQSDMRPKGARHVLISGAMANEKSYEIYQKGKHYGALSYYLAHVLANSPADISYRELIERVSTLVKGRGLKQSPQLEGPNEGNIAFGASGARPATGYLLASPSGQRVKLNAGTIHGVTPGSVYAVYPPGTTDFDATTPTTELKIFKVDLMQSRAKIVTGGQVVPGSRAVETRHVYPEFKFRLFMPSENPRNARLHEEIERALRGQSHIRMVADASTAELLLVHSNNEIQLAFADGSPASGVFDDRHARVGLEISELILKWADWFRVLEIDNKTTRLRAEVNMTPTYKPTECPPKTRGQTQDDGSLALDDGECFAVRVKSLINREIYVHVLDFSSDGSVAVLYPTSSDSRESLKPGVTWSKSFETFVPDHLESVRDHIKTIVSTSPIDLRVFEQEATRSGSTATDPLSDLLDLRRGPGARSGTRSVGVGDWATATNIVDIYAVQD